VCGNSARNQRAMDCNLVKKLQDPRLTAYSSGKNTFHVFTNTDKEIQIREGRIQKPGSPSSLNLFLAFCLASSPTLTSTGAVGSDIHERATCGGNPATYCVERLCSPRRPAWCVGPERRQGEKARRVEHLHPPPPKPYELSPSLLPKCWDL